MRIERWRLALGVVVVLALLALSVPWGGDLGWAYLAEGRYARAERMFTRALRDEPGDADLWLGLAATYAGLGDPDRQIGTLEEATRRLPGRRDLRLMLADAYQDNKDPSAAARVLEDLTVEPHPDDGPLLDRLLTVYLWAADSPRELAVLRKMVARDPTDLGAATELASAARSLNRQDEAAAVLEAYVRRRPDDPEGHRALAQVYDSLGRGDRALEHWRVLARLAPRDVEARDRLLPAPGSAPREEGVALLEHRREADPRDETARQRLVAVYRAAGDGPRALGIQREIVALRPRDPGALVTLGRLLVEQDRGPEAVPIYERALEIEPGSADTALALAQLYEWANDPRRALALLERVARARPGDRALQERVAALARGTEETPAAVAALDRLAALQPDGPYARQAVDALVGANRLPEAIARQRLLAERTPAAPGPALRLAELYGWNGQEREAIAVYEALDRAGMLPEPSLARLAEADERASLSSLYAAARALETLDAERLYPAIAATARRFLQADACQCYVLDGERMRLRAAEGPAPERPEIAPDEGLVGLAVRLGRPVSVRDHTAIGSLEDLQGAGLLMAAPLMGAEGALLGCITVTKLPFLRLTPASLDRLGLVADWGARSLENARTHEQARAQTIEDELVRAYTYAYYQRRIHEEEVRADRYRRPLAVVIFRIHRFGAVAAERRAELGRVLSLVFTRTLRDVDIVCRYATEDAFAIILPETEPARAEVVVDRLSTEIRNFHFAPYTGDEGDLEFSARVLAVRERPGGVAS